MKNRYRIEIEGNLIGTTYFEFADVPMGVLYGKINFLNTISPYKFIKSHCVLNKVQINMDDEKLKLIDTVVIPELKIYDDQNIELIGWGGAITGIEKQDDIDFEIQFGGVESELMKTKFPNHYYEYFK